MIRQRRFIQCDIFSSVATKGNGLAVVNDADDSAGDGLSYTDDFVQNSDTDVILEVTDVGSTMSVKYTTDAVRAAGKIYYSLTHLGRSY